MKETTRWFSARVDQEVLMARWGHFGQPVLVFPTAGGDAEEIERMLMIRVLEPLISGGRIKVYSVDSVAARSWGDTSVPGPHKARLVHHFGEFVRREVVPAIHNDCGGEEHELVVAGASIGAFNAMSMICRYPDVFRHAICMSGSYDVERFIKGMAPNQDFYLASPQQFLPRLPEGKQLELLRTRFVQMCHGGGRWEDPQQDWTMAQILGAKRVPNRVDPWGEGYDHDWPTWRAMLPKYLGEL